PRQRRPVARPARPRVELLVGAEQRLAAARAAVGPLVLAVRVLPGEGSLGALLAQHVILLRRERRPPLGIGLLDLLGHPSLLPRICSARKIFRNGAGPPPVRIGSAPRCLGVPLFLSEEGVLGGAASTPAPSSKLPPTGGLGQPLGHRS